MKWIDVAEKHLAENLDNFASQGCHIVRFVPKTYRDTYMPDEAARHLLESVYAAFAIEWRIFYTEPQSNPESPRQ
jgi:hypothetical protein